MGPVALKVQTLNPPSLVGLLSEVLPGLLFCDHFWLLFFHLDRIVVLRDNCAGVPRLLREHFLMVIISSQIKRDLEMSEWVSSWTLSHQA